MSFADRLLREPSAIIALAFEPERARSIASRALIVIVIGGAAFGAAVGSFRGPTQSVFSALKIPLATLLTLSVIGPALWAIARAFDRRWTFRTTLALMLAAGARSSLVLLACAPLLWLAVVCALPYAELKQVATAAYALAGLSALSLTLSALEARAGRISAALCFVGVFSLVGAQAAWLLRPYIGDPSDLRPPLFAHGRVEGGVIGSLVGRDRGSPP